MMSGTRPVALRASSFSRYGAPAGCWSSEIVTPGFFFVNASMIFVGRSVYGPEAVQVSQLSCTRERRRRLRDGLGEDEAPALAPG